MTHATRQDRRARLALIIILFLALALRVGGIDRQSIWYDEGLSIYYARGNWGEILSRVSASDHPPLHPLALHLWMALCGDSEFSVRMFSAWWGIVAVALIYRLGKRISRASGALAALLLAVSPFAVWYSQETRGYTMALALIIGVADVTLDLLVPRRHTWWHYVAYTLLATAAVYTHYFCGFVLAALNIAYLLLRGHQAIRVSTARRSLLHWLIAQLAILACLGPWLPFVVAQWQVNATHWHGAVGWRQIVRRTLVAFSVGETLTDAWSHVATWVLSLLAGLGTLALVGNRRDRPRARANALLYWAWLAVPTLILIAINRARPKFSPRYLMNSLPPFLLLASAGIESLFRLAWENALTGRARRNAMRAALAAMILVAGALGGATTRSLANHYLDQQLYRPDFRAVAQYIQEHATPGDLIALVGGHSYPAFTYYYRGPLPVLPLPDRLLPTTQQPIDLSTLQLLSQAIDGRQNLWIVLWQAQLADPTGLIVDTVEQTYHRLGVGREFHGLALLAFDVSPGPLLAASAEPQTYVGTTLGDQVRFVGYDLPVNKALPGETLYLYLYWEALRQVAHDYKVFTQILDESGRIIAQQDRVAGAEAYPSSHWPTGATVRDRFLLTIEPSAPPGQYSLIVGLYNPGGDMPRLLAKGQGARGDHILLSEIAIAAP